MEGAERRERLLNHAIDIGFFAHVAAQRDGIVADGAGGGFGGIGVDVRQRDAGALARVSLGYAFADARAGAGHKCDFAIETHEMTPFATAIPRPARPLMTVFASGPVSH